MQGRAAGAGRGAQDEGQEDEDLVEAQAHRGGGDGELLPSGLGEVDGLREPVPELGILVAEGLELVEELRPRRSAGMLGLDGGLDLLGMVVDGLSATVGPLGLGGDVAVRPGRQAAALAIQVATGILSMGGGPSWVRVGEATAHWGSTPFVVKGGPTSGPSTVKSCSLRCSVGCGTVPLHASGFEMIVFTLQGLAAFPGGMSP